MLGTLQQVTQSYSNGDLLITVRGSTYSKIFAKIYGFSCENGTISWKKPTNTKTFRDTHVKSHFGESEGEILQHVAKRSIHAAGLKSILIQMRLWPIVLKTAGSLQDPRGAP